MKYKRTSQFIDDYNDLPSQIKKKVAKAFKLFKENPKHPSLHTKKIKGTNDIFEGRIDRAYRFTFH